MAEAGESLMNHPSLAESIRRAAVLKAKLEQPRRDDRPEEAGGPAAAAGRGQGPDHPPAAAAARGRQPQQEQRRAGLSGGLEVAAGSQREFGSEQRRDADRPGKKRTINTITGRPKRNPNTTPVQDELALLHRIT